MNWPRATASLLIGLILTACSSAPAPKATARPTKSAATPTPATIARALAAPGPLNFAVRSIAQGLVAPWALAFAADGSIWLTERPGRVRVIRGGQLLPAPALTLNVVTKNGCESGLLGIAIQEPYVFVAYTYAASGNVNRVSRFTIQGDTLVGEKVLLDGIPGGTCYHFAGRLKIGPDGYLYVTTGDGYVPSRAASATNLSGKILRLLPDGTGQQVYAWGFRNPQGLAFDASGRLYVSNHGPTGEFGLCCHDELDQVEQGGFYGWPGWAGTVATRYGQEGMPQRVPPIAESGEATWAPSGMTFFARSDLERETLLVATLRGQALRRLIIAPNDPRTVTSQEIVLEGKGRLRDVVAGPDHCAYLLTNNTDTRGTPQANDDHLYQLCPS
jgi:glucose/arabinose dehydrogenase